MAVETRRGPCAHQPWRHADGVALQKGEETGKGPQQVDRWVVGDGAVVVGEEEGVAVAVGPVASL